MGKSTEVHCYNPETGEFIQSYSSIAAAEQEIGTYRGKVSEFLAGKYKSLPGGKYWSRTKTDRIDLQEKQVKSLYKSGNGKTTHSPNIILTEDQLRKKHDMFYIVHENLERLEKGKFVEEASFLRSMQISGKPGYRTAIDHPDVRPYKGKADGFTYYGHPESVQKLKDEGVLK